MLADTPEREWDFRRSLGSAEFADWRCYVAFAGDQPAAMAGLYLRDGVGVMASAETRPEFRRHGCHTELLRRRISDAAAAGVIWC